MVEILIEMIVGGTIPETIISIITTNVIGITMAITTATIMAIITIIVATTVVATVMAKSSGNQITKTIRILLRSHALITKTMELFPFKLRVNPLRPKILIFRKTKRGEI